MVVLKGMTSEFERHCFLFWNGLAPLLEFDEFGPGRKSEKAKTQRIKHHTKHHAYSISSTTCLFNQINIFLKKMPKNRTRPSLQKPPLLVWKLISSSSQLSFVVKPSPSKPTTWISRTSTITQQLSSSWGRSPMALGQKKTHRSFLYVS